MIPVELMSAVGIVAGLFAVALGIAQLTCEHQDAPFWMRVCVWLLTLLAAWTAIDSWDAWSGVTRRIDYKAVAFCVVLALYWGYRRSFGIRTDYRRRS